MKTNYENLKILNAINQEMGRLYGYEFPVVKSDTFKAFATTLLTSPVSIKNSYFDFLNDIMCKTTVKAVYNANNPFKFLYGEDKSYAGESGTYTQEIAIDQFIPEKYDPIPDADDFFKTQKPHIKAQYLINVLRKKYEVSFNDALMQSAFDSLESFNEFYSKTMERLYKDMEEDDKEEIMAMLNGVIESGNIYLVPLARPTDRDTSLAFTTKFKTLMNDLNFKRRRQYNVQNLSTKTDKDDAVLILAGDVSATQEQYNTAWAFNKDYLTLIDEGRMIETDSEGLCDGNVYAFYTDKHYFVINPLKGFPLLKNWENGSTLETKYWLHNHKMLTVSYSSNALAFIDPAKVKVKTVKLRAFNPNDETNTATVKKGKFLQLGKAEVSPAAGFYCDNCVEYSIEGNTSPHTMIDKYSGCLYIAEDENGPTITITGVSHLDPSKKGTFTVNVQ